MFCAGTMGIAGAADDIESPNVFVVGVAVVVGALLVVVSSENAETGLNLLIIFSLCQCLR
jgi:hypothetical protein